MRRNPENRIQTLAEKYLVSSDLVDAMSLADEYLRTTELKPKSEYITDMEVANVHAGDLVIENQEEEELIYNWLTNHCIFRHTDANEFIIYIGTYSWTTRELPPKAIRSVIKEAYDANYKYLCFYFD